MQGKDHEMREKKKAGRRGFAILLALAVMITSAVLMLAACGSGGSSSGGGQEQYNTETAKVTGKCYVFTGMSYEGEEYEEDLLKEIFDINDLAEYMTVYFEKGGAAYVSSLLYDDDVKKGQWGEDPSDGVTVLQIEDDLYEIEVKDDGTLQTYSIEEDGEEYLITLREPEEVPEVLKPYVK
ncbi:MAG: hypothetical protein IJH41_05135 [Eubacterium sp.]|nr:hypothetical protein [Eubacterium sp.]